MMKFLHLQILTCTFFLHPGVKASSFDGQSDVRPKVQRIADKLGKGNMVHFGYAVGFAARPETNNKYFKLYHRLKSQATSEELTELTKCNSEIIVIYAFNILHSGNFDRLKDIFQNHVYDTTWFWTAGGCTGFVDRINWFMLRQLRPLTGDTSKNLLTKTEYDFYCEWFKQEDKEFTCD